MKSRLLLIPLILATTAAMGDPLPAEPADGQAQAAALLSRPQTLGISNADGPVSSPSRSSTDGQASAAALLSRPQTEGTAKVDVTVRHTSQPGLSVDGQAKAAALLSRPRMT